MKRITISVMIVALHTIISATEIDSTRKCFAPRVFLDCEHCDFDYIRTEIGFVNYVIDRKEADVYVLETRQRTGSGGRKYTLVFIGKEQFRNRNDTLYFSTREDETWDDVRKKMVKTLKLGLVPYISRTPMAEKIDVTFDKCESYIVKADNWDNWVFRTQLSADVSGQEFENDNSFDFGFSADRITEDWKIQSSMGIDYKLSQYEFEDKTIEAESKCYRWEGLVVKSLSDHWSIGAEGNAGSESYTNIKGIVSLRPAIEYNIYPYAEANQREFSFIYSVGLAHTQYRDTTIYNKIEESLFFHRIGVDIRFKQPWGEIDTYIGASNYFPDVKKNHLSIRNSVSLHLIKGFSLYFHGGASRIRDQLSLPKEGVTEAEHLLQVKEIETDYSYWFGAGFEYTFGSIFNNIVNPRF